MVLENANLYTTAQKLGPFFFEIIFILPLLTETHFWAVMNNTTGTFQCVNDNIIRVILTRYLPDPKRGKDILWIKIVFNRRSSIEIFYLSSCNH